MTNVDRPSVAVLTSAPAPYRIPFFDELARRCRLLVVFETRNEQGREWAINEREFQFPWMLLRSLPYTGRRVGRGPAERWIPHIPLNVLSALNHFRPDVVISAELGPRTASAAMFCGLRKRPLIAWWEGTPHTEEAVSGLNVRFRKALLRRATRTWGNGEESANSLVAYGVPRSRIDLGMTGLDTERWSEDVDEARSSTRAAVRERLGLQGFVLLFVGSLALRKGLEDLLAALSLLAEDRDLPRWSALFVGSGPLAHEVEAWARLRLEVPIAVAGFVQPSELAPYFGASDLFVMPSLEDVWGMVCLEAFVAGLPQVTSSLAGAASSIVTSSEIGDVVDPRDARGLAQHLAHRIRLGPQRVPAALRRRAINEWSPVSMAERAMSSIHCVVGRSDGPT
jgi:glycosyltransferase involved in cell wall biosynthesis